MNFIFLSPNFPESYRNFCIQLKQNGVNVLAIGDSAYDDLHPELRAVLTEYYKVDSMENYGDMVRAVGYFTGRYGKIDWLESNNEYWLELDAALRTDFNITTGLKTADMARVKHKSVMKEYYRKAGLTVARCLLVNDSTTEEQVWAFVKEVGYPVVAKPDNGVGAIATFKLKRDEDTAEFLRSHPSADYLMEEFVPGCVTTYDGVCNSKGEVLFAVSHITPTSIMDMVNEQLPCWYYVDKEVPADVAKAGKAVLKSFGVKARCFHLEFFRLTEDKEGLGKQGDLVALEVNMRPAGGYTTDMINFSQSSDIFRIYADMVVYDEIRLNYNGPHTYCAFLGRRDGVNYAMSHEDVRNMLGEHGRFFTYMNNAMSTTMGNQVSIACFDTLDEVYSFVREACRVL